MCISSMCFFFFFSSRRRHTRFDCDWSSDVCSSDLTGNANGFSGAAVANGGVATATAVGLSDSTSYHWQARAVDQTARAGPWVPFGDNTSPDFRVAVAVTQLALDRKSTRLNSSHSQNSHAL